MPEAAVRSKQGQVPDGRSVTMLISAGILERIDACAEAEELTRSDIIRRTLRQAFPDPERVEN